APAHEEPAHSSHSAESGSLRLEEALLAQAGRLALTLAQVIELSAAHARLAKHLDLIHRRAVEREGTLDADAVRGRTANRVGRASGLAATHGNDDTLEDLDALIAPFDDLLMDAYGIARRNVGK